MQISFINNGVFLIIAIVNSMVCFTLFGVTGSVFGVLTVLFTHIVYAAKPDNKNILYVWFLLVLVVLGGAIGYLLKLSIGFYIYLFYFHVFIMLFIIKMLILIELSNFLLYFPAWEQPYILFQQIFLSLTSLV